MTRNAEGKAALPLRRCLHVFLHVISLHWQTNSLIVAMEDMNSPLFEVLPRIVARKVLCGQINMEVFDFKTNRACIIMDGNTALTDIEASETYGVMIGDLEYTDPIMYLYWLDYIDSDFSYAEINYVVFDVGTRKRPGSPSLLCSERLPPALRDNGLPQVGQKIKMKFANNRWYQGWVTFVDHDDGTVDMKFKDGDKLSEQNWALLVVRGIIKRRM